MTILNTIRDTIGTAFVVIGVFFLTPKGKVQLVERIFGLMMKSIRKI